MLSLARMHTLLLLLVPAASHAPSPIAATALRHGGAAALACVLFATAPCAALPDDSASFGAAQPWALRIGGDMARDARERASARLEGQKNMQDDRLRQCEGEQKRWQDCFFFGTGGDAGAAKAAPIEAQQQPGPPRRAPPTW